ncbi:cellulase family glycosylhydrolase [Nocardiopsis ganjiahuensis]|uniref:cellulase family glycosylhydrolase n=1 Tax=Nocardiopsis ganjiahuensis TaxID=239984 RepID=UPI000348EE00|nr:cellulase family glycosylhydrolase [Nocardiopsis ganjiahuensis]
MAKKRLPIALTAVLALTAALLGHTLPANAEPADAAPADADTGFSVSDGRLVDAEGNDFVMRGVSHPHSWYTQETGAFADIKSLGANTVRVVLSSGDRWDENGPSDVADVVSRCKAARLICMLEVHDTTGYGEEAEAATLDQAVDYWLRIQSVLEGEEDHVLVNIGNEPYGNDDAANQGWAEDTSAAVQRLRAAGFDHTLVVDAPNWGQDWQGIMREGAQGVFDADPHANTVFSIHMYGVYEQESAVADYLESFTDAGLPLLVGEFGHLHSDGDPDEDAVMAHAERLGLGYIGWSWSGNSSEVDYLDMVNGFDVTDLTPWGERIFHGPNGIAETAVEAPVYGGDGGPTDPPPTSDCEAVYKVLGQWNGGFQAEVTVTALTDISGWNTTWTHTGGASVSSSWNASVTEDGPLVQAASTAYNGTLAEGESTSFGFTGNRTGTVTVPDVQCAAAS